MASRFVLILILLLPLRVWAGDWMAITMLQSQLDASVAAAMPADCPGHVTTGDSPVGETGDCCDSCELCLPFTQPTASIAALKNLASSAVISDGGRSFPSADLTPTRKPPRL